MKSELDKIIRIVFPRKPKWWQLIKRYKWRKRLKARLSIDGGKTYRNLKEERK